jgi:Ca2+-binding EF-hand superfamily protein
MSTTISSLASYLFAKIDTGSKGYIEKTDFESAFSKVSSTTSTSSADELFSKLDSNGDGKLTQDEMSTSIQKLADALDSQFQSMRMAGAMGGGGMPPPPPANDAGFTKEELQSQLDSIGSSDSTGSSLISKIISNFSAADTNGDGKVSLQEAMAYDQSNPSSSATASSGGTTSSATSSGSSATSSSDTTALAQAAQEMKLMLTIMQLMNAYQSSATASATSSVSALA